tara:strand:+ start:699 stop:980 length:282 start_codon:yes stop_codon:yes gene_type:complete
MPRLHKFHLLSILLAAALLLQGVSMVDHVHLEADAEQACLICGSASADGISIDIVSTGFQRQSRSQAAIQPGLLYLATQLTYHSRAPPLTLVI